MLSSIPVQLWAVLLAVLGVVVAIVALFHRTEPTISQAVLAIASNLVSGALGAFAGHAAASSKADVVTGNAPVTINQADPKD